MGRGLTGLALLAGLCATQAFAQDKAVEEQAGPECDAVAASPLDPDLPTGAEGISFAALDPTDAAVEACLAAAADDPNERRYLANLGRLFYKRGETQRALESYRLAHGRGSVVATNNLGAMYERGEGVPESQERATDYYRKAANRGLPYAMRVMAGRAREGVGTPANDRMAVYWYRRGHDAGDAVSTHDLGQMYAQGRGVRQDATVGLDYMVQSLERDPEYALAAYNVGQAYETGNGTEVDLQQARQYYERAGDNGDGDGAAEVGRFYVDGLGVDPDPVEAATWYGRGAALGSLIGMVGLAEAYQDGRGVPRDDAAARSLYESALDLGPDESWRTYITGRMDDLTDAPS